MIVGQTATVEEVLVPPSRLVEHGTQNDTIGWNLLTSVSSTNHDSVTYRVEKVVSRPAFFFIMAVHISNFGDSSDYNLLF